MSELIRSLVRHARARPEALAVREINDSGGERSLTWRQLRDAAFLHATRLRRAPRPGVVTVSSPNRIETMVAILGGLWADAAVLPISPELQPAELLEVARRASVTTLVGDLPACEALSGLVTERIPLESVRLEGRAEPLEPEAGGGGSILLQSSGTTGTPKIVRRRAAALDAVGEGCRRAIGVRESDSMLLCIPLCHSYAIDQGVLTAVIAGCAVELHGSFQPARVRSAVAARGITTFPGVPVMFDALARTARRSAPAHGLRCAISAGSPLPRRVFDEFLRIFGVKIGGIYGSTEFGSVTYNDPGDDDFDPEAVGRPISGVEIRIVDASEPRIDRPLPNGAVIWGGSTRGDAFV
jgi:acyl-CoA synthetase (AMP-forming)/AMP-acid ligase II